MPAWGEYFPKLYIRHHQVLLNGFSRILLDFLLGKKLETVRNIFRTTSVSSPNKKSVIFAKMFLKVNIHPTILSSNRA